MTDRTAIIAPGTLPGRARATRKAHDRRTRLARESRAASPAGRARPETASRDEYRVLRSKPSNISLTPQSTRLDLPLVPPRQRPGHTQQHIHRQRRLTEHPPYQIRQSRDGGRHRTSAAVTGSGHRPALSCGCESRLNHADVIAADRRTVCIAQTAAAETRPAARPAALPLWTRTKRLARGRETPARVREHGSPVRRHPPCETLSHCGPRAPGRRSESRIFGGENTNAIVRA